MQYHFESNMRMVSDKVDQMSNLIELCLLGMFGKDFVESIVDFVLWIGDKYYDNEQEVSFHDPRVDESPEQCRTQLLESSGLSVPFLPRCNSTAFSFEDEQPKNTIKKNIILLESDETDSSLENWHYTYRKEDKLDPLNQSFSAVRTRKELSFEVATEERPCTSSTLNQKQDPVSLNQPNGKQVVTSFSMKTRSKLKGANANAKGSKRKWTEQVFKWWFYIWVYCWMKRLNVRVYMVHESRALSNGVRACQCVNENITKWVSKWDLVKSVRSTGYYDGGTMSSGKLSANSKKKLVKDLFLSRLTSGGWMLSQRSLSSL